MALAAGLVLMAGLALVSRPRVFVATDVVVALLSGFLAFHLVQVSAPATEPVVLDSPLTGEWFVSNGGRRVLLNGHTSQESNAIDFLRLDVNGRTHKGGADAPLADYPGFGLPVMAPADGRIVGVADGYADNPPGTNSDRAIHVVMDIGAGRYVLMAHLKQGSVTVQVGDVVWRGQPLAAVGNDGHSSEPHLHMQVQDSPAATTSTTMGDWNIGWDRWLQGSAISWPSPRSRMSGRAVAVMQMSSFRHRPEAPVSSCSADHLLLPSMGRQLIDGR